MRSKEKSVPSQPRNVTDRETSQCKNQQKNRKMVAALLAASDAPSVV